MAQNESDFNGHFSGFIRGFQAGRWPQCIADQRATALPGDRILTAKPRYGESKNL
jgi:hypothetical protein